MGRVVFSASAGEDSQSFLEAFDGVILDSDALQQIVDLLVPVLVLFFQGQ
jgi:hypothetical protein